MDTQQPPRRLPKIKFRVLIIGRANAGKTSVLQRVCDTTESPVIYRRKGMRKERIQFDPSIERGEHRIEDEIVFSNHDSYIFHDSCGFESGGEEELKIVQNFVRNKSREKLLASRLHAIWYCIPMDNQRPELDLRHFKDICPDQNVPVIAVFTKYDQFKRDIEMDLEDGDLDELGSAPEIHFQKNYLCHLGAGAKYVQLEKMHKPDGCCKKLIEETAGTLNYDVVTLMLVAVQRGNVELSVKLAVKRTCAHLGSNTEDIVKKCLEPFPYIWFDQDDFDSSSDDFDDDSSSLSFSSSFFGDASSFLLFSSFSKKIHIILMSIFEEFSSVNSRYHLMTAIIIILKHATTLRPSGLPVQSALSEAKSNYQKFNIGLKIAEHFTAPPHHYSIQDFVDFIMGITLGSL